MKKKYYSTLPIILLLILLSACGNRRESKESKSIEKESRGQEGQVKATVTEEIIIEVEGQQFQTILYDNETAQALIGRLPMTMGMEDLHGNEKFYYLEEKLPTQPETVHSIKRGDIMLFGSDCLVLFYEDFDTTYSYTKIGHVKEADTFANMLRRSEAEQVLYFKSN